MLKPTFLRASCWAMVLLFPAATVLADVNTAMVHVVGNVQVNGARTARPTALFAGDRVQTGADSAATLSTSGSTLLLGPASDMLFQGNTVLVRTGSVAVATSKGLAVQVGNLSIKPAKAERTRFEIRDEAGTLLIVAREGSLSVSNGKDMVLVEPGQTLSQSADAKAPSMPRATSSMAPGLIIGLIIAAGVATGVGLLVGNDEVSPQAP